MPAPAVEGIGLTGTTNEEWMILPNRRRLTSRGESDPQAGMEGGKYPRSRAEGLGITSAPSMPVRSIIVRKEKKRSRHTSLMTAQLCPFAAVATARTGVSPIGQHGGDVGHGQAKPAGFRSTRKASRQDTSSSPVQGSSQCRQARWRGCRLTWSTRKFRWQCRPIGRRNIQGKV